MAYPAESIANVFIDLAKKDGKHLSNMKLQKLLYFAQGHSFSLRGEELIEDDAEAWEYGPVYADVYHALKHYGAGDIAKKIAHPFYDPDDKDDVDPWCKPEEKDVCEFLRAVWNAYKDVSPIRLSEMSHVPKGPWAKVRRESPGARSAVIPKTEIRDYFKSLKKAKG